MKPARHNSESGFAMLFVFVMAAAIAITLYREVPRVVFESQRAKEQTLIDRGEQYRRAIQIFVRKFQRFPSRLEELENMNGIRFLRQRYKDPMTDKDEWRLVHVGPGGVFMDSLLHKPPEQKEEKSVNTFTGEGAAFGSAPVPDPNASGEPGGLPRRRASDMPRGEDAPEGEQPPEEDANNPVVAGAIDAPPPGAQPYPPPPGVPGVPGVPAGQQAPGTQPGPRPGTPGQFPPGVFPFGLPGPAPAPGMPTGGAGPYPVQPQQQPQPGVPGVAGAGPGPATQNEATRIISNLLTRPRPGGLPGAVGGQQQTPIIGGGIAGVASTLERRSIKVYNEREQYNEWEFLFDLSKETGGGRTVAAGPVPGTPAGASGGGVGIQGPPSGMGAPQQPPQQPPFGVGGGNVGRPAGGGAAASGFGFPGIGAPPSQRPRQATPGANQPGQISGSPPPPAPTPAGGGFATGFGSFIGSSPAPTQPAPQQQPPQQRQPRQPRSGGPLGRSK